MVERVVGAEHVLELDELLDLVEEEVVDLGEGVDLVDAPAHLEGVADVVEAALAGDGELAREFVEGDGPLDGLAVGGAEAGGRAGGSGLGAGGDIEDELVAFDGAHGGEPLVVLVESQAEALDVHRADGFLERFLEGAPDGHGLADGFHLGGEGLVGLGELLESPAGHLGDDVVDGGLEAGAGGAGDVVLEFVEGVADGEARGDLGDGEAGGL